MYCMVVFFDKTIYFHIEIEYTNYIVTTNLYTLFASLKFMARTSKPKKRLDDMLEYLWEREQTKNYTFDNPLTILTGITYLTKNPQNTSQSPIILLLNKSVSAKKMRDAYTRAQNKTEKGVFPLFHKGIYFRNAVSRDDAKIDIRNKDTLRDFSQEELAKAVLLSPAEKFVRSKTPALKYFQPADALRSTKIQTYTFAPLLFTPGPDNKRLEPEYSKRYFLPKKME